MDVRLSPEQVALRDSAALVVDRLGVHTVAQLDDPERAAKLDAAVRAGGWRDLRAASESGGPWATGVEVAIIAEELGRGLADAPFVGPTLAAELRRLVGAPQASGPETVALASGLTELACVARGALPGGGVAIDARGATSALVLVPAPDGLVVAEVALASIDVGVDLTRPTAVLEATAPTAVPDQARLLSAD